MTRTRRAILQFTVAWALAVPGGAHAEWTKFFTMATASTYAVDPDRVKTPGSRYRVWVKGDHSYDQSQRAIVDDAA